MAWTEKDTHRPLADLGGVLGAHPPMGPNSFIFAYIFTEKHLCRRSMPPLTGARPPMGNPGSATEDRQTCKTFTCPSRGR